MRARRSRGGVPCWSNACRRPPAQQASPCERPGFFTQRFNLLKMDQHDRILYLDADSESGEWQRCVVGGRPGSWRAEFEVAWSLGQAPATILLPPASFALTLTCAGVVIENLDWIFAHSDAIACDWCGLCADTGGGHATQNVASAFVRRTAAHGGKAQPRAS